VAREQAEALAKRRAELEASARAEQEKLQAEQAAAKARQAKLDEVLREIRANPQRAVGVPAARIYEIVQHVEALATAAHDVHADDQEAVALAISEARGQLVQMHTVKVAEEAEQARER
jgi:hypothetical protein